MNKSNEKIVKKYDMKKMELINNDLLIKSQSCEDVTLIAKRLSEILEIGDILFLKGSIGAGKSFFARCIIREYLNILECMRIFLRLRLALFKPTTILNQKFVMLIYIECHFQVN